MAKKKPTTKTQKEISVGQQTPYDVTRENPNHDKNRGDQTSFKGDNTKPFNIGFKDIDESILYYFENIIQPFVIQNGERVKIPIIYASPEKWKSAQKDGYYRDNKGKIMNPLIIFRKNAVDKRRTIGNKLDANNPNNFGVASKKYSPKNAYDNFSVLTNKIPEKTYYATVIPDYVDITYDCIIYTNYIEQLNKIMEAIEYASDSYWGDPERFKFAARIDSFNERTETQTGETRIIKCEFSIKLYGHIIPDIIQKDTTFIKKFTDKSQIIFDVETTLDESIISRKKRPTIFVGGPGPTPIISGSGGICANVTVLNTVGTYSQSVASGNTLIIPNVYIESSIKLRNNHTSSWSIPSAVSFSSNELSSSLEPIHLFNEPLEYIGSRSLFEDLIINNSVIEFSGSSVTSSFPYKPFPTVSFTVPLVWIFAGQVPIPNFPFAGWSASFAASPQVDQGYWLEKFRVIVSGATSYSIDSFYYASSSGPSLTIYATQSYGTGLVRNSGSSVSVTVVSGLTASFPNTYISNSNGTYTASIASGTSSSIRNTYISNSNGTYTASIPSGVSSSIPNTYISSSPDLFGGQYIASIPSAVSSSVPMASAQNDFIAFQIAPGNTGIIPGAYVSNSLDDYNQSFVAGISQGFHDVAISTSVSPYIVTSSYFPYGLIIEGAGSSEVNAIWIKSGSENGADYYYKYQGDGYNVDYISYDGSVWNIYINTQIYYAESASTGVQFPWLSTAWGAINGLGPVPSLIRPKVVYECLELNAYASSSDGRFTMSIAPGTSASIPDAYSSNSNGTYILLSPPGASSSIRNTYISNSNGTYTASIPSGVSSSIPNTYISNSNGTYTASIPSGVSSSIINTYISNSNGTYTASIASGTSSSIRNTYISNSNGTYTASIPSGVSSSIINTYIQNNTSSATWTASINSCVTFSLSSSIIRNPDGTNQVVLYIPSSSGYIYDATTKKVGIIYESNIWTGDTASYGVTGSEGWLFSEGLYTDSHSLYPINYAHLNTTASNPFTTLVSNNTASNLDRFTDLNGAQIYSDNLIIDHLTGWMWYRITGSNVSWSQAISAAEASTQGGYTDWHLPTAKLIYSLHYGSQAKSLNYSPFNLNNPGANNAFLWTNTTNINNTNNGLTYSLSGSAIASQAKTNGGTVNIYMICRKHLQ